MSDPIVVLLIAVGTIPAGVVGWAIYTVARWAVLYHLGMHHLNVAARHTRKALAGEVELDVGLLARRIARGGECLSTVAREQDRLGVERKP